jgi:6-phosphogluconolactonase
VQTTIENMARVVAEGDILSTVVREDIREEAVTLLGVTPQVIRILWHRSSEMIIAAAADHIAVSAARAIRRNGLFRFVATGGATAKALYGELRRLKCDWVHWQVYLGDERCLQPDDQERNSTLLQDALLAGLPIARHNIFTISAELGSEVGAAHYAKTLAEVDQFDLVLLSLGEDGHVASLFRFIDAFDSGSLPDVLSVSGAPKPPPDRISLSPGRLSRTDEMICLAVGQSKTLAVRNWLDGNLIPAKMLNPEAGIQLFVDAAAMPDIQFFPMEPKQRHLGHE